MRKPALVVSDARLDARDGVYWDPRHNFPQGHWDELLRHFGELELFARARPSSDTPPEHMIIPSRVHVREAPYYHGARGVILALPRTLRAVWRITAGDRLFVLRGPALLSIWSAAMLTLRRKPYLAEVLGDAGEALRHSSVPFRRLVAFAIERVTRAVLKRAAGALYVIDYLQDRYPARPGVPTAVITDARLPDEIYRPPRSAARRDELRLVMVANMEQPYKGHPYLFEAIAMLRKRGVPVRLRLVGDGRLRGEFEAVAKTLGVADAVEFLGAVAWGEPVFRVLDDSDLFILTSLTEGLPKALLEAMARGLPAIGTRVGGLPDVLPEYALFPPADASATAAKIEELWSDPAALARLAESCYATAQRFRGGEVAARRREFYALVEQRVGR